MTCDIADKKINVTLQIRSKVITLHESVYNVAVTLYRMMDKCNFNFDRYVKLIHSGIGDNLKGEVNISEIEELAKKVIHDENTGEPREMYLCGDIHSVKEE